MENTSENKPWIKRLILKITPPDLKDNTADVDRLVKVIKKALSTESVRNCDYNVCAILFEGPNGWHLIDIVPSRDGESIYGLAVDLGSSTVVIRLLDLISLKTKDEMSFHNPQIEIGTDILTRIHFAAQEGGLAKLQGLIIERLAL